MAWELRLTHDAWKPLLATATPPLTLSQRVGALTVLRLLATGKWDDPRLVMRTLQQPLHDAVGGATPPALPVALRKLLPKPAAGATPTLELRTSALKPAAAGGGG